jgi:benzylsuccinate CoA-transferase BbsF subunit
MSDDVLRPLDGVRVADFYWLISGPSTSRFLADYGAEVIKIESELGFDEIRIAGIWPPNGAPDSPNAVFADVNTNKRSFSLNMKHPKGVELARELIKRSDVVTNNFSGERMDAWGLGYKDLVQIKPDIIMVTMPAMGTTGPLRNYGANGYGIVAFGGVNTTMGFPGRPPIGPGPLYSDFVVPYFAVSAIAAALHHRSRTGEGQFIDLAQVEASVALLGTNVLQYTTSGVLPERPGNRSPDYCPHGAYPCWGDDRWCVIAARTDAEWRRLCDAIDRPELADDPRFLTFAARKANEDALDAEIAAWTRELDPWQVTHYLQGFGLMAGVVENVEDLVRRDPHMPALHFQRFTDRAGSTTYTVHGQPAKFDGRAPELHRPPTLGEHNEYVLKDLLGLDDETYAELLIDGAIR